MHVYSVLAHRGYAVSYYRSQKCILVGKKKKDLILHFYIGQQTSLFSPLFVSTPPLITNIDTSCNISIFFGSLCS